MKRILYIGQYTEGTTSKMRADILAKVSGATTFDVIDTHKPFFATHSIFRSIGFRLKKGPLVWNINSYIKSQISNENYDLVWIDKGIFLTKKTIQNIRLKTKKLVHFTPDMAFYENQSNHFVRSLSFYDFLISTKTKEKSYYLKHVPSSKFLLTTQGYSKEIHHSYHIFDQKENAIVFIGLAEPSRFEIAQKILDANIKLKLVGKGWQEFVLKNRENPNLEFIGESVFGEDYSELLSSSYFALGLLSKRFPELHTTRTFEIPACKTALITERNEELSEFYEENEVLFYDDIKELIDKFGYYKQNIQELEQLIENAYTKVQKMGYDYESIIKRLLSAIEK